MAKDGSSTIVPGTVLAGAYRAVRVIGVGGMGVVVHAERLTPAPNERRDVAIKFLLPQFSASREAATRFVREARAVTRIRSEHVARVLDVGTSDEHGPFIAMEYLAGTDLARRARKGPRPSVELALDWITQAADALAHAHAAGVVHRDVKPANLFLSEHPGEPPIVKVLDFGISKLTDDAELGVTKTTTVLGSGLYMSPEQMRSAKGVDHRSDIYGLGISLYELLSGTQPFTAETYPDLCIKVAMDPPEPLRRHRADIPDALALAIEKAYARKPEDRYPSVAAFMRALEPWANEATRARIDALEKAGRPHLRLESSPSIPPPDDAPRERSADLWRDALADEAPAKPLAQTSLPDGLSNTSAAERASTEGGGSTRTVLFSAIGTFVVLAATVSIYLFAIRPRSESSTPSSMGTQPAEHAMTAAAPSARADASVARAAPSAATAPTDAVASATTSAAEPPPSVAATPPNGWTPPKSAPPSKTATGTATAVAAPPPTAPAGDPFACVNPVTHLREACH